MVEFNFIGDVNPIQHGGAWIQKLSEDQFRIIKIEPCQNRVDYAYLYDVDVDLSDSWIEKASVRSFCDAQDDYQLALGCLDYYGSVNFGQSEDIYLTHGEAVEWLKYRDIEVEE
jgi:hypothetical protein